MVEFFCIEWEGNLASDESGSDIGGVCEDFLEGENIFFGTVIADDALGG